MYNVDTKVFTANTSTSFTDTGHQTINNNSLGLGTYAIGYGEPKCNEEELINIWINTHNESDNGFHYHEFVITGMYDPQNYIAKKSSDKYMVKMRLFHIKQYFHTIEYKFPSDYCLDNAYRDENKTGIASI